MKLWTIKIGTSLLRGSAEFDTEYMINAYCRCIARAKDKGNQIIIVSSGAVGLGCNRLGIKKRPNDLNELQAIAAVGQGYLMSLYEKAMQRNGFHVHMLKRACALLIERCPKKSID